MHEPEALKGKIVLNEGIVGLRFDGIIHVCYFDNVEINVDVQLRMLDAFNEITGGKKSLFLFEAGNYVSVTDEAKDNAILIEDHTPTLATVVLVKNLPQKLIADFYYKFKKPKQPYKVVRNFEDGISWLIDFQRQHQLLNQ